jgi:hypothetical protein
MTVLTSDSDALEEATKLLRSEAAADWTEDQINTYLRGVVTGKPDDTPWDQQFEQRIAELTELSSIDYNSIDPDEYTARVATATLGQPSRGVLEVRSPPKPEDEGVPAALRETWKLQEAIFDPRVITLAREAADRAEAEGDTGEAVRLRERINSYGNADSPAATIELRESFGKDAWQSIYDDPNVDSRAKASYGSNPLLATVNPNTGEVEANFVAPDVRETLLGAEIANDPNFVGSAVVDGVNYNYFRIPGSDQFRKVKAQ